ncbi:MAG: hypothetical protein H5T50_10315 [Nitrososphaeria archaeon]|nr:hypothetical protein [Nitrososphaeria archaeon]
MKIKGTGNILLDAVCSLGLFESLFRIKPTIQFKLMIGSLNPIEVIGLHRDDLSFLKNAFKKIYEEERLKLALSSKINIGGGKGSNPFCPPTEYFRKLMGEIIDEELYNLESGFILEKADRNKAKSKKLVLLPMSLMPIYGKGLNIWDAKPSPYSMYSNRLLVLTYMIGLAYYSITYESEKADLREKFYVILAPPFNQEIGEEYLMGLRRITNIFMNYTEEKEIKYLFSNVPSKVLPLLIFSTLDISTLSTFLKYPPQLITFSIEKRRSGGEAVRKFELISSTATIHFLYCMGEEIYPFKIFIRELLAQTQINELSSLAIDALINMANAIQYKNSNKLLLAYYVANLLKEKSDRRIKIPNQECLVRAIEIIS